MRKNKISKSKLCASGGCLFNKGLHSLLPVLIMAFADIAQAKNDIGLGERLLLAQKDGRIVIFLPESHIGSPQQDDIYFRTVVKPAFSASTALLAERASASWFEHGYDASTCPDENIEESGTDDALNKALQQQVPEAPPLLRTAMAADKIEQRGRFIRFYLLFTNVQQRVMGRRPTKTNQQYAAAKVRNAQSGILLAGAPRRVKSVDNIGTWHSAYCSLPPQQRTILITDTIRRSNTQFAEAETSGPATDILESTYRANDVVYRSVLDAIRETLESPAGQNRTIASFVSKAITGSESPSPADEVLSKFVLEARNRLWIDDLPDVLKHERLPFYAIGAAHFVDSPYGPGLITLLQQAGYSVELVARRQSLDAALKKLAKVSVMRDELRSTQHILSGSCQQDGSSYGCSWSDSSVSYRVLSTDASTRQEIWSLCFDRDGLLGPEQHCVSSVRYAGTDRVKDFVDSEHINTTRPPSDSP